MIFCRKCSVERKLDAIIGTLDRLNHKQIHILVRLEMLMATIDEVLAGVTELDTLEDSLIALVQNIKSQLDELLANQGIPAEVQAKIDAVFAQVETNKAQVADAVSANTPTS